MQVKIISATPNIADVIMVGARNCYYSGQLNNLIYDVSFVKTDEEKKKFLDGLRKKGHLSPFEHGTVTFGIEGISRACQNQLVRHRLASFSVRSQRYVTEKDKNYHLSQEIFDVDMDLGDEYVATVDKCYDLYERMIDAGVKKEDARYVLPNSVHTTVVMTMNVRELYHFFDLRMDKGAQKEIRTLANNMYDLCKDLSPILFDEMGE